MRTWSGLIAVVYCLAAAGAIVYLHGFERAQGQEDWQYRPALIRVYSDEVVSRAGPCVVFAAAAALSALYGVRPGETTAVAVLGSSLPVIATYQSIQQYIVATPGQLMATTVWDGVSVLAWLAAVASLSAVVAFVVVQSRRKPA